MRRLPLLLLLLAACDARLDTSRRITLVPDRAWSNEPIGVLQNAAESWNVELGTQLVVSTHGEQEVPVRASDFACGFTNGVTTTGSAVEVHLCSIDITDPSRLFSLVLHEMGHVANIRSHADDPDAVMSAQSGGDRRFTAEDRELFRAANPGHAPPQPCAVARPIAFSNASPVPLRTAAGAHVLWAEPDGVHIGRVDPDSAVVKRVGRIPTAAYPEWVRVTRAPEGLWVSWVEQNDMLLAHLRLPTMQASAPLTLEVGEHDFQRVIEVSTAAGDTDLFVAITQGLGTPTLYVHRVSRTTGEAGPTPIGPFTGTWAYLVELGPSLLLAARHTGGITLHELARSDGHELAVHPMSSFSGGAGDRAFRAAVVGDALYLALRADQRRVSLLRAQRHGDAVLHGNPASVQLPGEGYTLLSIDGDDDELVLAVNSAMEHEALEAYATRLDARTLEQRGDWYRLSAPDQNPSVQPRVLSHGGRTVVFWRELYDQDTLELKARCF